MENTRKVALVDLDGTYITCNSFHMWIRFMLTSGTKSLPIHRALLLRLRLYLLFILRKTRALNHSHFKRAVQMTWHKYFTASQTKILLSEFIPSLQTKIAPYVHAELVSLKEESTIVILTTAAPEEYASKFAESSNLFLACIATSPATSPSWHDNVSLTKRIRTLDFLGANDLAECYLILFTDHIDDLYLIEACHEVHLLLPISENIAALSSRYSDKIFHVGY
ncbi:MAG: haloacid dehalogenase-like hydrolase [Halieaceae bacterium]